MNKIVLFLVEVILTLAVCMLAFRYLRPYLRRILTDLCGTEERGEFWTVFSHVLLVGLPLLISLGYTPLASTTEKMFFELVHRLSGNLTGFLIALVGVGGVISVFSLFAPRKKETV